MKKILTIGFALCMGVITLSAQESSFSASANASQIETGKVFRIQFEVKNLKGEFEPPDFEPFNVVGGPNQSSSIQMINGQITQEYTYTYFLQAPEPGVYLIPEANLITEEEVFQTAPIEINVVGENEKVQPKEDVPPDSSEKLKKILQGKEIKKL